jgi:hypothetical protein
MLFSPSKRALCCYSLWVIMVFPTRLSQILETSKFSLFRFPPARIRIDVVGLWMAQMNSSSFKSSLCLCKHVALTLTPTAINSHQPNLDYVKPRQWPCTPPLYWYFENFVCFFNVRCSWSHCAPLNPESTNDNNCYISLLTFNLLWLLTGLFQVSTSSGYVWDVSSLSLVSGSH